MQNFPVIGLEKFEVAGELVHVSLFLFYFFFEIGCKSTANQDHTAAIMFENNVEEILKFFEFGDVLQNKENVFSFKN